MTQMVQTFRAPDFGLLGFMEGGKPMFYRTSTRRHTASSGFDLGSLAQLPRVDIVYAYAGMDSAALDAFVLAGARGIVLAGLGNGGYPSFLRDALLKVAAAGIPVVVSSRTGSGISIPDDAQLISADNLNPQKARILLMAALTLTSDRTAIETMFGEY
jgi:L-asparaginase/Glu-tRNA(Gln) amidotransferase subunit D